MSWLTKLLRGPDAPILSATSGTAPGTPSSGAPAGAPSRGSGLTGAQLRARLAATPVTTFREGYDQDAIDDLLDEVVVALRARG